MPNPNENDANKPQRRRKVKTIRDEQTGKSFTLVDEEWPDIIAAWISFAYSLAIIALLGWVLLDTWLGIYSPWFTYQKPLSVQSSPIFKLVIYTAIGGGIGAAVNNIRSFIQWHAELEAFGWRFVGKYIAMPPLGATLAVMVYAIIRGGIAAFSGDLKGGDVNTMSLFAAWATGALAGYGSHKVFIWLDDKVNNLFKLTTEPEKVTVPDLSDKTQDVAATTLQRSKLVLGAVSTKAGDKAKIGKVIEQLPKAGTEVTPGSKVDIKIGIAGGSPPPNPPAPSDKPPIAGSPSPATPDSSAKKQVAPTHNLQDITLKPENGSEKATGNEDQAPKTEAAADINESIHREETSDESSAADSSPH